MALESATYISGLNANNPVNLTDQVGEGDDHLRLVKSTLLNTFPNITGAMTRTHTQLNNTAIRNEGNTFTAANVFSGELTASVGLAMGSLVAATPADLSDHLALYSTSYGMNVQAGLLNFVVNSTRIASLGSTGVLKIFDGTGADSVQLDHDGTDANMRFLDGATVDMNFDVSSAMTGQFKFFRDVHLVSGSKLQIRDSSNADTVTHEHDGTDYLLNFVGTADVKFGPTNAPTAYYYFNQAGTDLRMIMQHNGSDVGWMRVSAAQMELRSLIHGASFQLVGEDNGGVGRIMMLADPDGEFKLYHGAGIGETIKTTARGTGITSGGQVKDHAGTYRDMGFNVMPDFNVDASDTLEASHCGKENRKTTTTARTLTLAANTDLDFPVNGVTYLSNEAASGNYTINEGTGTTLYIRTPGSGIVDTAGGCTLGPGGYATLKRISATVYHIMGTNLTP